MNPKFFEEFISFLQPTLLDMYCMYLFHILYVYILLVLQMWHFLKAELGETIKHEAVINGSCGTSLKQQAASR